MFKGSQHINVKPETKTAKYLWNFYFEGLCFAVVNRLFRFEIFPRYQCCTEKHMIIVRLKKKMTDAYII